MGPLKLISDLPDNFLIMNGDVLTDLDFGQFYDEHVNAGSIFTVSAYTRYQKVDYGVLNIGEDGKLTDFIEKPTNQYQVSMGVYMANKNVLEFLKREEYGNITLTDWSGQTVNYNPAFLPSDGLQVYGQSTFGYHNEIRVFADKYQSDSQENSIDGLWR